MADSARGSGMPAPGKRSDARRNNKTLLAAAAAAFIASGVDVAVRDIAARAGVGVGTIYRHFPTRADLIAAVYRHQVEECAQVGSTLLCASDSPLAALTDWIDLFIDFLRTFRTEIEERSVIKSAKTLEAPETIGLLLDQVGGRLGTTQRIMKASLRVALEQGATTLLPKHFAEAIELGKLIFGFKENLFASYASSIAA